MRSNNKLAWISMALCSSLLAGCAASEGNQQVMGGVGGAAVGCGLGFLIGGGAKECVYGAMAGAAAGWGAVKLSQYNASQVRTAQEDQKLYGLTNVSSTLVKIQGSNATPQTVKPGQPLNIMTDYSVQVPKGQTGASVQETLVLKKDGKVVASPAPQTFQRTAGGYQATASLPIPANAPKGTYVIETQVKAGTSYDVRQTPFVVGA
jgi:hypothetical protein